MIVKHKQWKSRISQERVEEVKKLQEVQNNLNPNPEIRFEPHPEIWPVGASPAYMDEIIQGMKDLRLKLTTLEKSNVIKEKQEPKREFTRRCIWCVTVWSMLARFVSPSKKQELKILFNGLMARLALLIQGSQYLPVLVKEE
ncbi:hypothetical protein KP509_36G064100 [Ceratopteris richardii]|uniref:Uncharacterized protein n=1 Tax=Ceratopteris richardii TaxID=49495 RepID=A0A8T2QDV3_CERRI|nr:hypothetical protein KP509_36G064100 [Ceratopteris richardii]